MLLTWILGFSLLGSVGAVGAAALFLVCPERMRQRLIPCLLSYAVGTLLGAAFLGLIPHALEHATVSSVMGAVLAGMVLFFVLEKLVLWRHCHDPDCDLHGATGPLILLGDALHNFIDGVVIAAAFLSTIPLGIATGLAVIVHEIPQELGDFAILLDSGYSRARALTFNVLSSSATLLGALLAYGALEMIHGTIPYVLALSAASFLYIAVADLIPHLHRRLDLTSSLAQLLLLGAGIGTIIQLH